MKFYTLLVNKNSHILSFFSAFLKACFIAVLVSACNNDVQIAEVNKHELMEQEALEMMPHLGYDLENENDKKIFVQKWVDAMLMQDELEQGDEKMNRIAVFRAELFKGELAQYFLTEKELMKSVDSTTTKGELEDYYKKHKDEFELQDFLVKALFIKLPLNAPRLKEIKEAYLLKNDKDIARIESYAKLYADDFYFDDENWVLFQEIRKKMPRRSVDAESLVLNRSKTYYEEGDFIYFINILDYKLKSESPPFEFIKDQIRERLIGQRMNNKRNEAEKMLYKRLNEKHDITINL